MHQSHIWKPAVFSAVLAAALVTSAYAQDSTIDPAVPSSDHHDLVKKRAVKVVQLFPDATRVDPGLSASAGMSKSLVQIHALVDAKNSDEAIAVGQKVIADGNANHFDRAVAYQAIGYSYILKGDNAKGAESLQKSLAENALSNNDHYQIMLQLVQTQINAGQGEAGLATLDRIISETKLDKPEYSEIRGRAYFKQKNYAAAALALQKAVDGAKQADGNDLQMLMVSYFELKQPENAEKIALAMLHKNPDDKNVILNLASIYGQAGQNDKAAAMLEDARKRGLLTDAKDYRKLYVIYSNMPGKDSQTIAVINEGLQKGILTANAEAYTKLAESYYAGRQASEAIDAYRKADALSNNGEAALNLARVLYNERRYPEARTAAQQAQQKGLKQPGDAKALLGQIDSASGKNASKITNKRK